MTRNEIVDLLSAITAYDNRNPNQAAVLAWGKAAELGRWTLPEALDAVHAHFAENPAYLMPAHVTARVRASRQDTAMREESRALTAAPVDPAAAERVAEVVAEVAKHLGWDDGRQPGGTALKVRCPHCGAAPGARCVALSSGQALTKSACHPSRAQSLAERLRGAS